MKTQRLRLLVFNDPRTMRIDKDLAAEIGLTESIFLLQIEYLIGVSQHERDGRVWTYQSLQDLHDHFFPFWSLTTISRIIKTLEHKELLVVSNYNKSGFDRTQWFALNEVGINKLQSVKLQETPIFQNEKWILHNGEIDPAKTVNRSRQNETTIPKTTTETTQTNDDAALSDIGIDPKHIKQIHAARGPLSPAECANLPTWLDKLSDDRKVKSPVGVIIRALMDGGKVPEPRTNGKQSVDTSNFTSTDWQAYANGAYDR